MIPVLMVALFVILIALISGKAYEHLDCKRDKVEASYRNYKTTLMSRCEHIHRKKDQLSRVFYKNKELLDRIDEGCDKVTFLRLTRKKLTRIDDNITLMISDMIEGNDTETKYSQLLRDFSSQEQALNAARERYVACAEEYNDSLRRAPLRFFASLVGLEKYEDHYEFHHSN